MPWLCSAWTGCGLQTAWGRGQFRVKPFSPQNLRRKNSGGLGRPSAGDVETWATLELLILSGDDDGPLPAGATGHPLPSGSTNNLLPAASRAGRGRGSRGSWRSLAAPTPERIRAGGDLPNARGRSTDHPGPRGVRPRGRTTRGFGSGGAPERTRERDSLGPRWWSGFRIWTLPPALD